MNERNLWDSINHPTGLADMVHVGWVQRLLRSAEWMGFPGPEHDLVAHGQTRVGPHVSKIFEKFTELEIEYVSEPTDSEPGSQRIRPVNEVLAFRKATCIDLCVAFCCAALDAGIYPLILTVTADGGQRRHAIVVVPMERQWAMGCDVLIEEGFSRESMMPGGEDLRDFVVESAVDTGGTWLAIDVTQVTGSGANWGAALSSGAQYIRDWEWDVCVDVGGLRSRVPDRELPPGGHIEKVLAPAYAELPEDFTPLQLIKARHGVVPYQQCAEMRQLRAWAMMTPSNTRTGKRGHNVDISVAVVTGAGGSGKTRMAAQLCHDLSTIGWYTGFLRSTTEVTDKELAALTAVTTELLVVVDYAEEARRGLIAQVVSALQARESATRIVLTARGADTWWEEFYEKAVQDRTVLSNTLLLSIRGKQEVKADPWFFGRMYRRAVQRFYYDLNGVVLTDVEVPEGLGDTALDVVLRAWLAVCGDNDAAERAMPTRQELYDRVLSNEFARWRKEPELGGISRDHLRQAAATLSLLGPSRDRVDEVLSRLPEWSDEYLLRSRFAELLVTNLLRGDGAEPVSLRPDPVAERLILEVFGKKPELLDQVLPPDPAKVPGLDDPDAEDSVVARAFEMGQQARNACVTLTRASSLDREVALRLARRALRKRPFLWKEALDVALTQGGPLASALEALIESGATLPLGEIDDAIPIGHPALAGAALAATRRLATSAEWAPDWQAYWANNLSIRLSDVGERNEALVAAREAVELYRALAEDSPAAYTPNLAASLNNLVIRLSAVGEHNEALVAVREAVRLRRALAEASPQAYTPDLAMSLNNLASCLSEVGEHNEAVVAAREAVELRRALAEASPAVYTPDLAMSLHTLASCLSAVGERNEALVAAREAVELYRGLAKASPAVYTPDLAMSLNNLANRLSAVGERNGALVAVREAVRLRRALAKASPAVYTPDLAMSLNNLATFLSAVGEHNEALVAAREAVELRRALAKASPQAYTPDLAGSLNNLANRLSGVGERGEALGAAREAVELYRGLAKASPQAYTPRLAGSLNNLADILAAGGRPEEAQAVFVEGIDRFSPAVRAHLLVARAHWRDDGLEAGDLIAAAREADSTDAPVLLGPVRRMIARAAVEEGIPGTELPRWATVDAESAISRIEGWLECSDLAQRVAFLEADWALPSDLERETLAALADLYVDRPPVAELAALVERVADEGIQAVATDLRTHHRAQLLARDWREAHVNGRGASFLREHTRGNPDASCNEGQISEGGKQESEEWEKDLGDLDMIIRVFQVLAAMLPVAEAAGMMSVLALAEFTDPRTAYDAHGSDEGAEDVLRELLEVRNWEAMVAVLGVRPSVVESTYGRIARLLLAAVNDEPVERLRELYEYANAEMDAIHRRQLQTLLEKALGTDQCPKSFSDLLLWVKQ